MIHSTKRINIYREEVWVIALPNSVRDILLNYMKKALWIETGRMATVLAIVLYTATLLS